MSLKPSLVGSRSVNILLKSSQASQVAISVDSDSREPARSLVLALNAGLSDAIFINKRQERRLALS